MMCIKIIVSTDELLQISGRVPTYPRKLGNAGSNSAGCDNLNTYLLINIQATFYPGRKRKTWVAT